MTQTLITLTPEELAALIDRAVEKAVARHCDIAMSRDELAEHFDVNPRTIDNWVDAHGIRPVTAEGKQKKYSLKQLTQARYEQKRTINPA